jgi:hypothetical protein
MPLRRGFFHVGLINPHQVVVSARFFSELERLSTSWAAFKSSRMQDVKWCHPKLTVEVKHLAGSKTLRHATVRKLCSLSVDTDSGGSGSSTGAYSTRDRIGCSCRIVGFGSLKRKHLVVAKRPKFQEPVSFIAEYDDGSTARFYVDRTTLRDGNHIARIVAGEKQRIGRLKPGIIVGVRRDWRHRLVHS